ncbi:Tn3 family transposase [Salmonella enterica subsp. enterica]|nr:hypothetical protein [Salmonella enterica]EBQ0027185.1 Tn3 family transposase [Salmonella enterica subsp. enterica]MGS80540.1 hypothetical protein [Escherichia coli]EBQ0036313.1 Tn3 family transposase [Salmonella enterica subsp. enterica]EBQ0155403.1 Tn3 family transposase [Salmonella enterica subsp. enterica]
MQRGKPPEWWEKQKGSRGIRRGQWYRLVFQFPIRERATQGLVEAGKPVDGELLQFLSPLGWEHINLTGDYVWRQSRRLEDGKFRPLRMPGKP